MKNVRTWYITQTGIFNSFLFLVIGNTAFPKDHESIILPKYFSKLAGETKKDIKNRIEKKISGLLKLQVQLRNSYREQPSLERLESMKEMGMRTVKEEIDQQLVYIHTKRKLSLSKISSLKKMGVIVYEDSWIPPLDNHPTGYIIARMPVNRLYDLAGKNFVIRLETAEQALLPQNDEAAKSIQADDVWNDYGYDGTGIRIAVLDSGLDTTHNDIPTPVTSKDYTDYPNLDDTIENEVSGHGTHVTGSVLGRGTQSNGKYKGIAYGADLIFLKIGNDSTSNASIAAISSAMKAAVDTYDADIITLSYGGFGAYLDGSDEKEQAVDYAFSKGAVVFVSAGNEADKETHYSTTVSANNTTDYIKVNVGTGTSIIGFYFNWYDGKGITNDLDISLYDTNKNQISYNLSKIEYDESLRGTECELIYYNKSISGPASYYLRVKSNTSSDQPFPTLWYRYKNATIGDTSKHEWYAPDGTLYATGSGTYNYQNGCRVVFRSIKGSSAASKLGQWQVKVSRNGKYLLTETFTIQKDTTAPSGSITINNGASSTNSTAVTLTLSATDNIGVTDYYVSQDSTTPSSSASGWTSISTITSLYRERFIYPQQRRWQQEGVYMV